MIECVLSTTKADKLQYLGQSLGAVLLVVGLSLLPVLCEKVADLVLLAPAQRLETLKVDLSYLPTIVCCVLYPFTVSSCHSYLLSHSQGVALLAGR